MWQIKGACVFGFSVFGLLLAHHLFRDETAVFAHARVRAPSLGFCAFCFHNLHRFLCNTLVANNLRLLFGQLLTIQAHTALFCPSKDWKMPIVASARSPLFLPKASRNPSLPPASPHFFEKCHNAREARLKTMDVPEKTWDFFSETLDFFQETLEIFRKTSDFFLRCSEISLKGTH